MKFTYILVIVCVLAVVAMAVNPDKAARKAERKARRQEKMAMKKEKMEAKKAKKEMCKPTISFGPCENNAMTITKSYPKDVDGCKKNNRQSKTFSKMCKKTITKSTDDCQYTLEFDLSQCGQGDDPAQQNMVLKVTPAEGCTDVSPGTYEQPCAGAGGFRKLMKKANLKKGKLGKNKKGDIKCKYSKSTWSECDPVTNTKIMERKLKKGNPERCSPVHVVQKPCKRKKKRSKGCKYKRGQWSECDGTTNIKTMVKTLKRGDPDKCAPTQVIDKICKRMHKGLRSSCKYKKTGRWGACDPSTGVKSREVTLKKGDPSICAPMKTVTKPCGRKAAAKKKRKACKYDKKQWSPCDAASNTVSRTLALKEGDPLVCNATKVQVKKCKARHLRPHVCKYRRTTWGECDPMTNMRVMVKTLKRGDPSKCDPTETVERKCKGKSKPDVCKYSYEPWSDCNVTTNTMVRKQVLKSGPASCQPVKEYSRKCKKPCKFESGSWSECDPETNQMKRIDTLKKATDPSCPKTRVLTKKCGKTVKAKRCVYDHGNWSDCDTSENPTRTRIQKLISGGPNCETEKTSVKSCQKQNGEERCFFGPWQEYEECRNGVQKRKRSVLQGGLECERKSVALKPC